MASDVINVLLVDHELECRANTSKLLGTCGYKVMEVELASSAIQLLGSKIQKFDIAIANDCSPDQNAHELLQFAVTINMPIILLSVDGQCDKAMKALEDGAILYVKKPISIEIIRLMWQYVVREKMAIESRNRYPNLGIMIEENVHFAKENSNSIGDNHNVMEKDIEKNTNNITCPSSMSGTGYADDEYDTNSHNTFKRRVRIKWTKELHAKFVKAIEQLTDESCFPKKIHELMNVPNLTRQQVATHLQEWRRSRGILRRQRKIKQARRTSNENDVSEWKEIGSTTRLGNVSSYETSRSGQGSKFCYETENNVHGDMLMDELLSITSHSQPLEGKLHVSHPPNFARSSSNSMVPNDDFFDFAEMNSVLNNSFIVPHEYETDNTSIHP